MPKEGYRPLPEHVAQYLSKERIEVLTDILGHEIEIQLQTNILTERRSTRFRCTLLYAKQGWVGIGFVWRKKVYIEHIPRSSII